MSEAEKRDGWLALNAGQADAAIAAFEAALRSDSKDPDAILGLARAHALGGKRTVAASLYRRLSALRPGDAEVAVERARFLNDMKRPDEALAVLEAAFESGVRSAGLCRSLAYCRMEQGDRAGAEKALRELVERAPGDGEAWNLLGGLLCNHLGRPGEAEPFLLKALELNPESYGARCNLASVYRAQRRLEDSEEMVRGALSRKPDLPTAHFLLGLLRLDRNEVGEAGKAFGQAVQGDPENPEYHMFLGFCHLLKGDYAKGLDEYEWRLRLPNLSTPPPPLPRWDGGDLHGRGVLLLAEQGAGDTIQFVRYAERVRDKGGRAVVLANEALAGLVERVPSVSAVLRELRRQDLDGLACYAPLPSLPHVLGDTPETIPNSVPYIVLTEDDKAPMARLLDHLPRPRVGVVWKGNPKHSNDRNRSAPEAAVARFSEAVSGVSLVSLQKYTTDHKPPPPGLFDAAAHFRTYLDTAAAISALDIVISVDTSVAHLAGALGMETWTVLPYAPEWRWGLESDRTPWYPTMRLFRQSRPGGWDDVFDRIAAELPGGAP